MKQLKELHIVTVGISLLTNFAKAKGLGMDAALKRHPQLGEFLERDPAAASAELNALHARTGILDRPRPGLGVAMVFTNTREGKVIAGLLKRFMLKRHIAVTLLELDAIHLPSTKAPDPAFVQELVTKGLTSLRQRVEEHVSRMRMQNPGLRVEFNVTGGFKAEVAVLYKLGRTLRLPVYYLHETFKTAIELP
jgi:putative CRISPR-associated protein (TIGR02619 family)